MIDFHDNREGRAATPPCWFGWSESDARRALIKPAVLPGAALPGKRCPPSVATQRCYGNKAQTSPIEHPNFLDGAAVCSPSTAGAGGTSVRVFTGIVGARKRTTA